MNKRFTKISTLLATVLLSMILIFACGIAGPTGGTTDTTTGGGDSSLSIMPTAVFSTSPELAAAASVSSGFPSAPFAYFFNTANRADSGILNPEKMSELFMPLFTGLKTPKAGEMSNNLTVDYVGYYLKRPILIKMVDKTTENTDDNFVKVFEFSYYQDNNSNKSIDVTGLEVDTQVAFVLIKTYTEAATSGEWTLTQLIANPFNPTEKFSMKATGIYGPTQLTGDGTFTATSGDYKGSAAVTWTKNSSGKKYIRIEDGKIEYKGTATTGFYNVTGLNITIDISSDNSSKVTEAATVVTKNNDGTTQTVVKQATTLNDDSGLPKEVAFTVTNTVKDINGVITSNTTKQGAKTISIDTTTFAIAVTDTNASTINMADLSQVDDEATAAKITVNMSKCPTTAMGKPVYVWVVKPEDMVFETDGSIHPSLTTPAVSEIKGVVSSTYSATLTTAQTVPAGYYVVYAMIDPKGDFSVTAPNTLDDFYVAQFGVMVDGRNGNTTINIGNVANNELGWMTFGSGVTDVRQSLDMGITFASADGSTLFTSTAISNKRLDVGLFELTSMGVNWDSPVGYSITQLSTQNVGSTLTGKLYIDGIVDFKNKKYTVGARLDMDGNGMDSIGDFFYVDMGWNTDGSDNVSLKFDNYNNKYFIVIPGFKYLSELKTGIDYSAYSRDGKPLLTSEYYAATNGATISGSVDFIMIDRYQASAWFAILMPLVNGPEEGTNTPPVAFAQITSTGTFTFSNFTKGSYSTGAPNYYNIVAIGYRNFDINYDKLRMPYQDDILAMKATSYTYDYWDPATQTTKQATNYSNSPLALTFNSSGSVVGIKWIDNGVFQPDTTVLTAADLKFDISMLYMDATSGDTGASGIEIGTGDKQVYVSVGFINPMYMTASMRPYWLNDIQFNVKIEKQVNGVWSYVTEYWSNFRDSAYNPMDYVSFECSKAESGKIYRFSVSQEAWNADTYTNVKYVGTTEVTIGEANYVYVGLEEKTAVVFDPTITDDVEIILQIPDTDTTYTKELLTGKFVYVELMDQNFVSKYIMKIQVGDFNYSYDGTNSYPVFGAKGTFADVPKYNYYLRAFIDWNGNVSSSMVVGTTYPTSSYSNVFPDAEDIHPNFANWTPMIYMDYEKYTDPNTGYTYPYNMWFSDWIEIPWGGTTSTTVVGGTYSIEIKYDNQTATDQTAYFMVQDSAFMQVESGSVMIPSGNAGSPVYANLYNLTSEMSYTVYVYVDTSVGGATMWPDEGEPSFSTAFAPNATNLTVFANNFAPYVDGGTTTTTTVTGGTTESFNVTPPSDATYYPVANNSLYVMVRNGTTFESRFITSFASNSDPTFPVQVSLGLGDYVGEFFIDVVANGYLDNGDYYAYPNVGLVNANTWSVYDGGTTTTTIAPTGRNLIINFGTEVANLNFYYVINDYSDVTVDTGILPFDGMGKIQATINESLGVSFTTGQYFMKGFIDMNDNGVYYPEAGDYGVGSAFYVEDPANFTWNLTSADFGVDGGGTGDTPKLLINYTNTAAVSMTVWVKIWDGFSNLYEEFSTMLPMGANYTEALLMNSYDGTINYYADVIIDFNQNNVADTGDKVNYNANGMIAPGWTFTLNEIDFIDYTAP